MKHNTNCILSVLLAVVMLVSVFGTGVIAASAEETYQPTDSYVLNYANQDIAGYEDYDNKRLYGSPYRTDIFVTEDGSLANWNWCSGCVLNMINTTKLKEGGEGAYASIGVYCVDAVTNGVMGYDYRRVNLEDSGYFSDETAGRIRAIITASFPHQRDMAALAAQVNAWIASEGNGLTPVANLNYAEAISATQSVIWTLTNEGKLNEDIYAGYAPNGFPDDQIVFPESMDFEESGNTASNIQALALYLNDLEPMAPQTTVISENAFSDASVVFAQQADGTYTATVTVTVAAEVSGKTDLEIVAVADSVISEVKEVLNGTNTYTLTLSGLKNKCDVTVNIDGVQDGSDVFLFDPANGRDASQTMAGHDDSALPAHAEITLKTDRILNILKTDNDGIPLKNLQFSIYKVADLKDYLNGKVAIGSVPTEEDVAKYAVAGNLIATVTTEDDGRASHNFGTEDGVYLVVELANTVIETPIAPFFVALPNAKADNPYVVTAQPKNTVIDEEVVIEKDVAEIDNDWSTYDVSQIHTWIIQTSIPTGLATGLKFEITDTLDHRLTFRGNVVVTVHEKAAKAADNALLTLQQDADYTLTVGTATETAGEKEYTVDTFRVELTPAGMAKVAAVLGAEPELRIYFDAEINENAQMGVEIPNQAHLEYINNVGKEFDTDSDVPEVVTGGLKLIKVDASNGSKLSGATFRLYREAAAGDANTVQIIVDGVPKQVVLITELTTAADGTAVYNGLAYGTYYLLETKAPQGYNRLPDPVVIKVNAESHLEEGSAVVVKNSSEFELPDTGGVGTTVFTVTGLLAICGAVILYCINKRKYA